jgi:hypothetical protein
MGNADFEPDTKAAMVGRRQVERPLVRESRNGTSSDPEYFQKDVRGSRIFETEEVSETSCRQDLRILWCN